MPNDDPVASPAPSMPIRVQVRQVMPGNAAAQGVDDLTRRITAADLDALTAMTQEIQRTLFAAFEQGEKLPSAIAIEFGIDVGGEVGIPFVTKGTIAANFKVSLEWKKGE